MLFIMESSILYSNLQNVCEQSAEMPQTTWLSGLRFFGPLPASGSTGPCSGPLTLINVVGKRNLNGSNVYLRWRSERDTLAGKGPKKRSPGQALIGERQRAVGANKLIEIIKKLQNLGTILSVIL